MIEKLKKLNNEKYDFDLKTKICILVFIFVFSSVIGWIHEELFCLIMDGELVKRGFLYGVYLPVYGLGAVFIVLLLKRFKSKPILFFLLVMLVTGVLEYIAGVLLYEIYHKTWWSYEGLFLNIDGYVCLRSVFSFAIGGLLLIYLLEPLICKLVSKMKKKNVIIISLFMMGIILIDFGLTLLFRNQV